MAKKTMESKILNIIKKRRSIRKFLSKDIEEEKFNAVLESARLAPSSSNSQPWHFVVVKEKDLIKKLSRCGPLNINSIISWMETAPVVIVALTRPGLMHKISGLVSTDCHLLDMGIAIEHMVLTAEDLGLGSCWIGWIDNKKVKKLLEIPKEYEVAAMLPIGYPDPSYEPHQKSRKSLREITSINRFAK